MATIIHLLVHVLTMTNIWDEIKQFYTNKKKEWANSRCYYRSVDKWGEMYGFTLADPYTVDEVEDYERSSNITLPADLKTYLVKVSRELHIGTYPVVFSLKVINTLPCMLPDDKYLFVFDEKCYNHGEDTDDCPETCDTICNGMKRIADDGCSFNNYIVVNGSHFGEVWHSSGEFLSRSHETFMKFVTHELPSVREQREEVSDMSSKENPLFIPLQFWLYTLGNKNVVLPKIALKYNEVKVSFDQKEEEPQMDIPLSKPDFNMDAAVPVLALENGDKEVNISFKHTT